MAEKLLIIDDEDTLCESLKRVFVRDGYEVDIAFSAEEAFDHLKEKTYDLIITDIILPGISGIDLLKKYKKEKPEQKIVIMTAYANLETAIEALRGGASDYIIKPLTHDEIKRVVRNALGKIPLDS